MSYEICSGAETYLVCESVSAAGDKLLPYTMPQAEYMYGCGATATGMLLGYYDLYGYTVNDQFYDLSNLIEGTISVDSRGSDGGSIYDMKDPSLLCQFIASTGYVSRFYEKTPAEELPYTFVNSDPDDGLNVSAWDSLADYLGTGQYWRQNGDLSTTEYGGSLSLIENNYWQEYTVGGLSAPIRFSDMKYGLSLLVESRGYALNADATATTDKGDFTFEDYKAEIDAGRPVLISLRSGNYGHMVVGYGYNETDSTLIFDDTYEADCRISWNGTYQYSGNNYSLRSFTTVVFAVDTPKDKPVQLYSSGSLLDSRETISGASLGSGLTWDSMCILSGGTASSTAVSSGGRMHVSSGGSANATTIYSSGYLHVSSGGSANSTTVNSRGSMNVSGGGSVNRTTVNNGGYLTVCSGGSANSTTVNPFGCLYVSYGGTANSTNINSGTLRVYSGGMANRTTVNSSGYLYVSGSGTANSATVNPFGRMYVYSGGEAANVVENGGYVSVYEGANVTFKSNTFSGLALYAYQSATLHSGTTAVSTVVNSSGALHVSSGGSANSTTVNAFGKLIVSSGGSADGVTVNSGASMSVKHHGAAGNIVENGGYVHVHEDADASFVPNTFSGLDLDGSATVHSGTEAVDTTILDGGEMFVYSGGTADSTAVNDGGRLFVSNGGTADNTTVNDGGGLSIHGAAGHTMINFGGGMKIYNEGIADGVDVASEGHLFVSSGGKVTGMLTMQAGAGVSAYEGSMIDFDISELDTTAPARVNDLSRIQGTPNYTITVSATQAEGVYKLAEGASSFTGSIEVCTDNTCLGSITVGSTVELAGQSYTLNLADDLLSFTVGAVVPVETGVSDDLNGDGRADIVMTITQSGHGAEGATGAWLIQGNQTAAWGDLSQRNAGWEIFGMGTTSANKTTNDVYVRSPGNVIGAWTTNESGHVAGWETVGEFSADTQVLGLGDFNGNGQTDLLLRNQNGAVGCYFTGGDMTGWNYFQSLGDEWKLCAVGDLNGDGRDDVVLKHDAGFAGSWLTQSDGTMAWADLDTLPDGFEIVGAGDFDGDGTDDVLLKNGNYYGAWLVQNGNAAGWMGLGDLGDVTVEQISDFDGDGQDDLRIRTSAGDLGAQLVKGADSLEWKYYGSVGAEWSTSLAAL